MASESLGPVVATAAVDVVVVVFVDVVEPFVAGRISTQNVYES